MALCKSATVSYKVYKLKYTEGRWRGRKTHMQLCRVDIFPKLFTSSDFLNARTLSNTIQNGMQ